MQIKDLPVGAKVLFGSYRVANEEPHRICWQKVHEDNTLLSEFIEDQLAFDAKEPDSNNHSRLYGSNRYSTSNIHQFLNGYGTNWFSPQTAVDTPPENSYVQEWRGYDTKEGFLSLFEDWELDVIEPTMVETAICNGLRQDLSLLFDKIEASVFLPSMQNLFHRSNGEIYEGVYWSGISNGTVGTECVATTELIENGILTSKPERRDKSWYYMLRSPYINNIHEVKYVDRGGRLGGSHYANAMILGIRPATKVTENAFVTEEPDENGYYEVLHVPQEVVVVEEDEFLAIIKV